MIFLALLNTLTYVATRTWIYKYTSIQCDKHAVHYLMKYFPLTHISFFPSRSLWFWQFSSLSRHTAHQAECQKTQFFLYLLGSFDLLPLAKMTKIAKTKYNHVDFFIRVYDACSAWASPSFSQIATKIRSKFVLPRFRY